MIATDRDALRADTRAYEHAERCIEHWAFERRRQQQQRAEFFAQIHRIRSSTKSETASTAVFHGRQQLTRKQRIELQNRERAELEQRRRARNAALRARRGNGPVRKCHECQTIYRGFADTCGCKPCGHCGQRFRGNGFKCESCKHDPALITARGTATRSFVPRREAQPSISQLSAEAERIQALLEELPVWMAEAIDHKYRLNETDHNAAEALMISVSVFAGRARAAVARVAEILATEESPRV